MRVADNHAATLTERGISSARNGQWQEAKQLFNRALIDNPHDQAALNGLGVVHFTQADLETAILCFQQVLALNPDHAGTRNNLGNALLKQGKIDAAIDCYRQALALRPDSAEAHNNLGYALLEQGATEDAIACLRQALSLQANQVEALCNLGNALQKKGDTEAAIECLHQALDHEPNSPEAHNNLGSIYFKQGKADDALAHFRQALALRPDYAEARNNLGSALLEQSAIDGAIEVFHSALDINPTASETHYNLGSALQNKKDFNAAIECFQRAISLKPNSPNAFNNLGIALHALGRLEEASDQFQHALRLQPDFADALSNLGNVLYDSEDIDAAIACHSKAIAIQPDHASAHNNLALALLMKGDYERGWREYEWRFSALKGFTPLHASPAATPWDGTPLQPGDRLLLVSEQGLGDTLQFMRYVLPLRERGIDVSLSAPAKLHGLIQASGIHPRPLLSEQAEAVSEGWWIPLLSLPARLGVSIEQPLHTAPYIHPGDESVARWRAVLAAERRPIIAINWQGAASDELTGSRGRSLPLEAFAPLAQRSGGSLLSLQKGPGSEQLAVCSFRDRFVACQPRVDESWDFQETAAIIANCDLVISSDTSVAHLSGGMGQTTWVLLKHMPEWRWGPRDESSAWYPSMRLFRQRRPGDWGELLERVAGEVAAMEELLSLLSKAAPPF